MDGVYLCKYQNWETLRLHQLNFCVLVLCCFSFLWKIIFLNFIRSSNLLLIAIICIRFWWSWSYFGFTNTRDTFVNLTTNMKLSKSQWNYGFPVECWSHWKCSSGLQKHMIFVCLHALLSCMLCFHGCTHVCFYLISNVEIARVLENRISIQTFEKWHKFSYRYAVM